MFDGQRKPPGSSGDLNKARLPRGRCVHAGHFHCRHGLACQTWNDISRKRPAENGGAPSLPAERHRPSASLVSLAPSETALMPSLLILIGGLWGVVPVDRPMAAPVREARSRV